MNLWFCFQVSKLISVIFFRRTIVLAFVSVLPTVRITNVWGYAETFPFQ